MFFDEQDAQDLISGKIEINDEVLEKVKRLHFLLGVLIQEAETKGKEND